ncbi:MAG: sulfatase-like hydrolase/transferase, partial [Verrucomicrobiota bacterium]
RNVMWSGLYSHNNGVEGFYKIDNTGKYKVVADYFKEAGYLTAIRGKVTHTTPYHPYPAWDMTLAYPQPKPSVLKDIASYGNSAREAIEAAKAAGKPFLLNVNISDPHKPFYRGPDDPHQPSRVFTAEEMVLPGFLFEDESVREELALYYSSVRRADDCVGAVLEVIKETGHWEDTIIFFLSDHGMPLPFAKTSLFHHSTRTPLMVRWPGVTTEGKVDGEHMVSAVDFTPTLLEMCGIDSGDAAFDGRSFASLLRGETQQGRDFVFKVYNENSGGNRHPMRGIETKEYLYLFNPWSDGERRFRTATQGTVTYKTLVARAKEEPELMVRLRAHDYRVYEELYQVSKDPDCLTNLMDHPEAAPRVQELQAYLVQVMEASGDHCLEPFQKREDPAFLAAYIAEKESEAAERRAAKRKNKQQEKKGQAKAKSKKEA